MRKAPIDGCVENRDGFATLERNDFGAAELNRGSSHWFWDAMTARGGSFGRTCRNAPSNAAGAARPHNAPSADACGRVKGDIRRRCFVPVTGTPRDAYAQIAFRW